MEKGLEIQISKALKFDALADAENVTGKSYKDDKVTESIGFINHISNAENKRELLQSVNDTTFSESEEDYLKKVTDFGFESLLIEHFTNSDGLKERLHIMFHYEYSILLCFDTFTMSKGKSSRNGGNFYYNWIPNNKENRYDFTSSGGFEKTDNGLVWIGGHDCREAIKFNINRLNENGSLLKNWVKQPFLWLLHHGDTENEGYDYQEINNQRILKLPKKVQDIINCK